MTTTQNLELISKTINRLANEFEVHNAVLLDRDAEVWIDLEHEILNIFENNQR